MKAKLSIVSTPIGNLEDITTRALRTLAEADLVLCEDTRVTKKLLAHAGISTPTLSYHAHSGSAKYEKIIDLLKEGKQLALVSDAGTPLISDPGSALLERVQHELREEVLLESVPGPSAVTAALAVSGVPSDRYCFLGFPPHKKGRKTFFEEVASIPTTVVFYESVHRIQKALTSLVETLSPHRTVIVCRELTKLHEETVRGTARDVQHYFDAHPDHIRGEFVVVVGPQP
jgi:16S rRNA (cytidine1402-2'-O)-methyltransferase